jgi:hypothetical protein
MSTVVDELIYRIAADSAALRKELAQVENQAKKSGKKAQDGFKGFSGQLTSMEAQTRRLVGVLAGIASVGALTRLVKHSIDTADAMAKMSQRTGVAVEDLSTLAHAGKLADVSIESIGKSIGMLARNMFDARRGTGEAKDAFKVLDIALTDSEGNLRRATDVMIDMADVFTAMPDGPEKMALAMKVFGRAGAELIPLLNSGSEGLRKMMQEARDLGLEIDTNTAHAAEEFNDNLTRLQGVVSGAGLAIAGELLPTVILLSEALLEAGENGASAATQIGKFLTGATRILSAGGATTKQAFKTVGERLSSQITAAQAELQARFEGKSQAEAERIGGAATQGSTWEDIKRDWEDLNDWINELWGTGPKVVEAIDQEILERRNRLADLTKRLEALNAERGTKKPEKKPEIEIREMTQAEKDLIEQIEKELELLTGLAEKRQKQYESALDSQEAQREALELSQLQTEEEKALWMTGVGRFKDWDWWQKRNYVENARRLDQLKREADLNEEIRKAAESIEDYIRGDGPSPFGTDGIDGWTEYAIQAARNIQTSLADAIEAGTSAGADSALESFKRFIRRMLAEIAAARLLNFFLGPDFAKEGKVGGFAASFTKGLGSLFGTASDPPTTSGTLAGGYSDAVAAFAEPLTKSPMPAVSLPEALNADDLKVAVNLKNVNAWDGRVVHDEMASSEGERVMLNFVRKNARSLRRVLEAG